MGTLKEENGSGQVTLRGAEELMKPLKKGASLQNQGRDIRLRDGGKEETRNQSVMEKAGKDGRKS